MSLSFENEAFDELIGDIRYDTGNDDADADTASLSILKRHLNGAGATHGGLIMSLVSQCMTKRAERSAEAHVSAVSITSDFTGPAWEGETLHVSSSIDRRTRTIVFAQATAWVDDPEKGKRPVMTATGVFRITD